MRGQVRHRQGVLHLLHRVRPGATVAVQAWGRDAARARDFLRASARREHDARRARDVLTLGRGGGKIRSVMSAQNGENEKQRVLPSTYFKFQMVLM